MTEPDEPTETARTDEQLDAELAAKLKRLEELESAESARTAAAHAEKEAELEALRAEKATWIKEKAARAPSPRESGPPAGGPAGPSESEKPAGGSDSEKPAEFRYGSKRWFGGR